MESESQINRAHSLCLPQLIFSTRARTAANHQTNKSNFITSIFNFGNHSRTSLMDRVAAIHLSIFPVIPWLIRACPSPELGQLCLTLARYRRRMTMKFRMQIFYCVVFHSVIGVRALENMTSENRSKKKKQKLKCMRIAYL